MAAHLGARHLACQSHETQRSVRDGQSWRETRMTGGDKSESNAIVDALNRIGRFLAVRDVSTLTASALQERLGTSRADLIILFGACIPAGWEGVASAYRAGIASRLLVVGGVGHTTSKLWEAMHHRYPDRCFDGIAEAEIIASYLQSEYDIDDLLIEKRSTNCGNNVAFAQDVVREVGLRPSSVILVQDPTMQRRIAAGFERLWDVSEATFVNFAGYEQSVSLRQDAVAFERPELWGMWTLPHYVSLLLGEVERLTDKPTGYGPLGKDFIAHVDVPEEVLVAARYVSRTMDIGSRNAEDRFRST